MKQLFWWLNIIIAGLLIIQADSAVHRGHLSMDRIRFVTEETWYHVSSLSLSLWLVAGLSLSFRFSGLYDLLHKYRWINMLLHLNYWCFISWDLDMENFTAEISRQWRVGNEFHLFIQCFLLIPSNKSICQGLMVRKLVWDEVQHLLWVYLSKIILKRSYCEKLTFL